MLTFDTSYGYDRISMKIINCSVRLVRIPFSLQSRVLLLTLTSESNLTVRESIVKWPDSNSFDLGLLKDGKYYLNIFVSSSEDPTKYFSYFQPKSLALNNINGRFHFIVSPIINENRVLLSKILTEKSSLNRYLLPSTLSQSDDSYITNLVEMIVKFKVTPYQKALSIHDWVSDNIYYDYDSLHDNSCCHNRYTSKDVLNTKRCVCRGYANLGVAMLRAAGIPSISILCHSINNAETGTWGTNVDEENESNHIISAAYIDERWLFMDTTWDSDNIFENGRFSKQTGMGVSRKYFDASLEMISNTHKFISIRI